MNDPHVCALCHEKGRGCCRLADEKDKRAMFGLTLAEVEVLETATGRPREEFTVTDQADEEFLGYLDMLHPLFQSTMPGGRRIRLKVEADGSCVFLGGEGCILPQEVRPLYCRLYPIWFTRDKRLMILLNSKCLAQEGARGWQAVLKNLGAREEDMRDIFKLLLEHVGRQPGGTEGEPS